MFNSALTWDNHVICLECLNLLSRGKTCVFLSQWLIAYLDQFVGLLLERVFV